MKLIPVWGCVVVSTFLALFSWRKSQLCCKDADGADSQTCIHIAAVGLGSSSTLSNFVGGAGSGGGGGAGGGGMSSSTQYSVSRSTMQTRPIFSSHSAAAAAGNNIDSSNTAAGKFGSGWNIGLISLWSLQTVLVVLVSVMKWEDVLSSGWLRYTDRSLGLLMCFLSLALFFTHLKHQIFLIYDSDIRGYVDRAERLEESLSLAKEAAENAERRREHGEIRLLRLLKMEKDSNTLSREKNNEKVENLHEAILTLQEQLRDARNQKNEQREQNKQRQTDLKTLRFQCDVARAEAQQLQGDLANATTIKNLIKQRFASLVSKIRDTQPQPSNDILRLIKESETLISKAKQSKMNPTNTASSSSSDYKLRHGAHGVAGVSGSVSQHGVGVADAPEYDGGGAGSTSRVGDGARSRLSAGESGSYFDHAPTPPHTQTRDHHAHDDDDDDGGGDDGLRARGDDDDGKLGKLVDNKHQHVDDGPDEYDQAQHDEGDSSDAATRLNQLIMENRNLKERNRITLRQVTTKMHHLENTVETQGHHLAAKEAVLTSVREAMKKLEHDNKNISLEVERKRVVVDYLGLAYQRLMDVRNDTDEWIKAQIEALQGEMATTEREATLRFKKIKQAESEVMVLRPSLGISIQKTPTQRGLEIKKVLAEGALFGMGVRAGDIILYINNQKITDHQKVAAILNSVRPGDFLSLLLGNDGPNGHNAKTVHLKLPFASADAKQLSPKRIRELRRLEMGLVRKQDVGLLPGEMATSDQHHISHHHISMRKPREKRPPAHTRK